MFYNDLSCAHCPVHSLQVGELVLCKFELPGCQDMFTVGSCSGCTVHTTTPGHCTARYNAPFPTAPTLSLAGQGVAAMKQGPSAMGAYDSGDGGGQQQGKAEGKPEQEVNEYQVCSNLSTKN